MDIDFASLAAKIAADVPGLRGCVIVSRDGLVLGAFPQNGEAILRPAWLRFASLGDIEKGFIHFPGELWVYARRGPYASFAIGGESARPGLILDQMEQVLANAEESRGTAPTGVTLPESPAVAAPPAAAPPAVPPPAAPPAQPAPQAPPPAAPPAVQPQEAPAAMQPEAAPPAAPPPQPVPQPPPPAAPPAEPPAAPSGEPPPVPVAPGPQVGYHADYSGELPVPAEDPTSSSPAPAPDDIQIDRVALAQEFASLLAETGYDDEDESA